MVYALNKAETILCCWVLHSQHTRGSELGRGNGLEPLATVPKNPPTEFLFPALVFILNNQPEEKMVTELTEVMDPRYEGEIGLFLTEARRSVFWTEGIHSCAS